jgi:hypothetical protein
MFSRRPRLFAAVATLAISALIALGLPAPTTGVLYDAATLESLKKFADTKFKNVTLETIESIASLLNATKATEQGKD